MRLLVVEDYPPQRLSLVQGLRESGYTVDASGDGDEGWWYASNNSYDCLILDLGIPGKSGLDIIIELRNKGDHTPILVLSAQDAVRDRVAGLDAGADDYCTKPCDFSEMLARIRALTRRRYGVESENLRIGSLNVERARRSASWNGQGLGLTRHEYTLLEYLALRHNCLASREELSNQLYSFDEDISSNALEVHISHLRKKLQQHGAPSVITTRRGEGYLLHIAENED